MSDPYRQGQRDDDRTRRTSFKIRKHAEPGDSVARPRLFRDGELVAEDTDHRSLFGSITGAASAILNIVAGADLVIEEDRVLAGVVLFIYGGQVVDVARLRLRAREFIPATVRYEVVPMSINEAPEDGAPSRGDRRAEG